MYKLLFFAVFFSLLSFTILAKPAFLYNQPDSGTSIRTDLISIPLEKGNKWFYSCYSNGTEVNPITAEVISDTIIFDNIKCYKVNFAFLPGSNSYMLRCDSNTVYFYNSSDNSPSPVVNFMANPGDNYIIELAPYSSVSSGYISTVALFNINTNIYEYHLDGLQQAFVQVSPDFGFTRIEDYGDDASIIPSTSFILKGCILSGIPYGETVSVDKDKNLVQDFSLQQNYPNPFNAETIIKYTLPGFSSYKIMLYDISGRIVKTLDSGSKDAGTYTYKLSDTGLCSGVYFIEIQANNAARHIKILLLK